MDCYKGNPFIESLPPVMDKDSFFSRIAEKPGLVYGKAIEVLISLIHQIRNSLFIPLSYHYFLYLKICNIIRENYRMRTPLEWTKTINEIKRWYDHPNQLPPFIRHPILGLSVLGVSGMGKSTMLDKILRLFPQMIIHKELGVKQVVYLKIDCTMKGSTKHICRSFFDELDRVTGENYSRKYQRDSEEKLMIQMANKAVLHQLGVLVIDEVHNLATATKSNCESVLNFFKELTNRIGVPIIYVGTAEAAPILFGNYQTASRTQGIGMPVLDRFQEEDPEWKYFVDKLWNCQIFPEPGEIPEEVRKMYYSQSQGVLREVMQVHCNAQEIALFNGSNLVTADNIRSTAHMLGATSVAMKGLRNNNRTIKRHFNDLSMTAAYLYRDESGGSEMSDNENNESKKLFDFAKKKWPKLSYAQLDEIINTILKGSPELSIDKKIEALNDGINNLERQGKTEAKPKLGEPNGDLIEMCVNAKTSQDYYNILSQNGIVVELSDIIEL